MNELRKLKLAKEANAKKIQAQIIKDTQKLNGQLKEIEISLGKDFGYLASLIDNALVLAEETDKTIYELLGVERPTSNKESNSKVDPKWSEYKKTNNNIEHILPDGTPFVLKKMGRSKFNAAAEAAWRDGTLKKA